MPHVVNWLEHQAQTVREMLAHSGRLGGPDEMKEAVEVNVLVQLNNLRGHPSVAKALAKGQIELHGWVYDIASGNVRAYDEQWNQFAAL
jgi:carbonic anhydrase